MMLGTQNAGDTPYYIEVAAHHAGFGGPIRYIQYVAYAVFIAPAVTFLHSASLITHVIVMQQIVLSALSVVFLYKSLLIVTNQSKKLSACLSLLYPLTFEVSNWDLFVLTDSFSLNVLIIAAYFLIAYLTSDKPSFKQVFWLFFMMIIVFFSRPTNNVFLLISGFFILLKNMKRALSRKLLIGISVSAFLVLLALHFGMEWGSAMVSVPMNQEIRNGVVLMARPAHDIARPFAWEDGTAVQKTVFMARVIVKKMVYFWHVYPDSYSTKHGIFNIITLLPFWLAGFVSAAYLLGRRLFSYPTLCIIAVIFGYNFFHALTIIDFDFRYRIVVIPFMFMLIGSAVSASSLAKRRV